MSAVPQFPAANDPDSLETQEWLDALEAVVEREGPERAHFLLEKLIDQARRSGANIPFSPNTAYINTIPPHLEGARRATRRSRSASAPTAAGTRW